MSRVRASTTTTADTTSLIDAEIKKLREFQTLSNNNQLSDRQKRFSDTVVDKLLRWLDDQHEQDEFKQKQNNETYAYYLTWLQRLNVVILEANAKNLKALTEAYQAWDNIGVYHPTSSGLACGQSSSVIGKITWDTATNVLRLLEGDLEEAVKINMKDDRATQVHKKAGDAALNVIKKATEAPTSFLDFSTIADFTEGTTNLINNPTSNDALDRHVENTRRVFGMGRRIGPMLFNAGMCVFGAVMGTMMISLAVGIGIAIPPVGAALAIGIMSVALLGIGVGFGGAVTYYGGFFAVRHLNGPVFSAGLAVIQTAEKCHNNTKK